MSTVLLITKSHDTLCFSLSHHERLLEVESETFYHVSSGLQCIQWILVQNSENASKWYFE